MKLYAISYSDAETKPQTMWTASISEAQSFITGSESVPEAERTKASIRIVKLPSNRAMMARWLNAENVGGWQ